MRARALSGGLPACALALSVAAGAPASLRARQQQPSRPPRADEPRKPSARTSQRPAEQEEVLQVNAELVQTAVVVVDEKGRFVEGLRREQFELRVDGRQQPVSFFEQVEAGTARERQQLAAARGEAKPVAEAAPPERGMTVFLFVDDLHLDAAGHARVRRSLLHYIDGVMGESDRAAVASTSGRIGFLQQLTDDKAVLRAAVARLNFQPARIDRGELPHISVYQAVAILEHDDTGTLDTLVEETIKQNALDSVPRAIAVRDATATVMARARAIAAQAATSAKATLATLEEMLRASARLPGRKIVFFFSEGFMPQPKTSDERERMSRVVDAAARSGAVLYAVDARGLATDPLFSATRAGGFDPYGLGTRTTMSIGELPATQQPLISLAADTGGRAVLNTNALDKELARALEGESRYYLLAWRPESESARAGKFRRVEVSIAGRPDLSVRLHRGYYSQAAPAAAKDGKATPAAATPQAELSAAVAAPYPRTELPTFIAAHYVASPDSGATLSASVVVPAESLTFAAGAGGRAVAAVDLACFLVDDQGRQAGNYFTRLDVSARAEAGEAVVPRRDVAQEFQFKDLRPGLYQLRAAARDEAGGRVGSASRWIEIPDLSKGRLALGGLVVGESAGGDPAAAAFAPVKLSAGRPFARGSRLHFSTHIYNAARGAGGALPPDVVVRATVARLGRTLLDAGAREAQTEGIEDPSRIPYAAEIDLEPLPAGRYLLVVTATDRVAGAEATQSVKFTIR